jgi:SecD/SecF fusion protein
MQRSVKWRLIIIAIILAFSFFSLCPTLRWATIADARKAELTSEWETQAKELRDDLKWNRLIPKEQLAEISSVIAPILEAYESGAIDAKFWERIKEGKLDSLPEEEKEEFVTLCGKLTGKELTLKSSSKDIDKAIAAVRSVQEKLGKTFWNWVKKPKWEQLSQSERQQYREIVQALTDWRIPRKPSVRRNVANWFKRWWVGDESQVISLGLDLKGGSYFILQVEKPRGVSLADAADGAIRVLTDRVNRTGVREPIIQRQGSNRIIVQLPGLTDINRQRRLIERQAVMRWMLVDEPRLKLAQFSEDKLVRLYDRTLEELRKEMGLGLTEEPPASALDERLKDFIPPDTVLRIYEHETHSPGRGRVTIRAPLLLQSTPEEPEVIPGGEVARAMATRSSDTGEPIISFGLSGRGARTFGRVTAQYNATTKTGREYGGWRLAILLDDKVISAPHIKSEILGGSGQIEGDFSPEEARDLAIQLKAGALPAKLNIVEQNTVGPTLGADTVRKGVFAAILGLALVVGFMLVYYLGAGLIANLALVLNMVIILGVMAALRATLTLPGIAGMILTIGMAVDANVLINERIREELAGGKKIGAAIDAGYRKAFLTILDSNLTTFICGVVLYYLGTGPVRGFAVTLIIGLATSMFTAIVVTRVVFDLLLRSKRFQRVPMLSIVRNPKYDFVAQMRKAVTVSIVVIVAGIICFGAKWSKNFGIDFTSGQAATVVFQNEVTPEQLARLRSALASSPDIEDFNLRRYRLQGEAAHRGVAVDGKLVSGSESKPLDQRITDVLSKENPRDTRIEPTVAKVYPVVAEHLWKQALLAVFVSLLAMFVYIWWRFEFRFALGGVIALLHDVLVTVGFMTGFFILARRQLNLSVIAAILTIIGYSINDTIVIFDRIREDMKMMKGVSLRSIINTAVNQTLSRTILTSGTTLLAVLAIFLFGGQAINDFAFAMLVGCISGVYSTVYIASPIALLLEKTR